MADIDSHGTIIFFCLSFPLSHSFTSGIRPVRNASSLCLTVSTTVLMPLFWCLTLPMRNPSSLLRGGWVMFGDSHLRR